MDYGYLEGQYHLAVHDLGFREREARLRLMPIGLDPYEGHYEETEQDFGNWHLGAGGQLAHQIPVEFGSLSHVNPKTGKYHVRYFYGADQSLVRDPGIRGELVPLYEARKFNQRLNPHSGRVGNHPVHGTVIQRTEEDMTAGCLAHFPNVAGLRTSALYKASGVSFSLPEAFQSSPFFRLFWNVEELRALLLDELFCYAEALSNLTRSCQAVRSGVEDQLGHFDTNLLDFKHCEKDPETLPSLVNSGKLTEKEANAIGVPKYLVIGPVRSDLGLEPGVQGDATSFWPPNVLAHDAQGNPVQGEQLFNARGFREIVGYTPTGKVASSRKKCTALIQTLRTFFYRPNNFHYVAINRMDFLNIETIEAIVDGLPNLQGLCIYSCPLIDLGQIRAIIQLVGKVNEKREESGQPKLDLDIAPQLRQGPIRNRFGSYGITHSDPKLYMNFGTDIGFALGANLVSLLRAADKAGIELCHPGKAFRRWLDRLPLRVNQAFNLCRSAASFLENEKTRIDYASMVYMDPRDADAKRALLQRFDDTVAIDLIVSARAKPLPKQMFVSKANTTCGECNETLPALFFRRASASRQAPHIRCEGCELNAQLRWERVNSIAQKREIASYLWHQAPLLSLDWLIGGEKDEARANILRFGAACLALPSNRRLLADAQQLEVTINAVTTQMMTHTDHRDRRPYQRQLEPLREELETTRVRMGHQRQPIVGLETEYNWDYLRKAYHWRGEVERGLFVPNGPYSVDNMERLERHFCM